MPSNEVILAAIGLIGSMGGFVAFLKYLSERKAAKTKNSSDAYQSYRVFSSGAADDRDRELKRVKAEREMLWTVRDILTTLVLDLLVFCADRGIPHALLQRFYDRLDDVRKI